MIKPRKLTLYHGTDARILSMSREEYASYFTDVDIALAYLWTIWKPLNQKSLVRELRWPNGELKGTVPISFLESRKQQFIDAGKEVFYTNLSEKVNMFSWTEEGAELYQYGSLYATTSREIASNYARNAFAGGERGLIVYRMLEGLEFLGIPLGNPGEKTFRAIQRVKSFAEANEPEPVIVIIDDVLPCDLLSEDGKPADKKIQLFFDPGILIDFTFRYVKDVDLSTYPVERI